MRVYFGINRKFAADAFKLRIDYDLDKVRDTRALFKPQPTPKTFLEKFRYTCRDGEVLEDMLANTLGWSIFSERLADVLSQCNNRCDIELHSLPEKVWALHPKLKEYRVLGIKKAVTCVDQEKSQILWGSLPNGMKHISSFRECVLKKSCIPENLDMFLIEEYPVMPIISSRLAAKIAEFYPTGFVFEKLMSA
jgi:hypothetical protein